MRMATQHMQQLQHGVMHSVLLQWYQLSVKQHVYRSKIQRCRQAYQTRLIQTSMQAFSRTAQLGKEQMQAVVVLQQHAQVRFI